MKRMNLLVAIVTLCCCSTPSPDQTQLDSPTESTTADQLTATGCTTVSSPFPVTSLGSLAIQGAPVPGVFSRPLFPSLIRQGPWSATQFVRDANGLTFPAIIATGGASGWMAVPFQSGDIMSGIQVWACGNVATAMFFDIFATITDDDPTDEITPAGSGGMLNVPNVWTAINFALPVPLVTHTNGMIYLNLQATSVPPPSMALAAVIPYFE